MIQPPKISPVGLASAGIGIRRSTGSRSFGSCTGPLAGVMSVSRVQLVVVSAMLFEHLRTLQLERRRKQSVVHGPRRGRNRHAPDLRVTGELPDLRVNTLEHQLLGLRQTRGQRRGRIQAMLSRNFGP